MSDLFVGVGKVDMIFRHSRTLKDKRNMMQSIVQRLKNRGFSVVDCGDPDNIKSGVLGFTIAGRGQERVQSELDGVDSILIGDFQVVSYDKEVFDYADDEDEDQEFLEKEPMPWEK